MTLTGRAGLVAVIGAAGVLLWGLPALLGVEALLLVGVTVDLVLASSVRALRFERHGDTLVRLGESATVGLVVTNPRRRRVRGRLRDAWPPSAGSSPREVRIDVPAGERRRVEISLTPTRRGDRRAAAVTVRSYGPLGLAARQGTHSVPWVVRVLPPFTSRRHLPAKLARLRELDGQQVTMVRGQGTEFDSLREYVIGDDIRSIDWRASARLNDIVVRTWRPERDRRVLLVLDTGRTSAGRVGDIPRLDSMMDAVLLLAAVASRAGDRVDMIAYDRRARASVQGATRGDLLPMLVQAMAPLEPELIECDAAGMVAAVLQRARHRCLVVVLTDLNAAAIEAGLLPQLGALTRRHLVLLAAVADPRVAEMAGGRGHAEAVYDAAAAERARADRSRITAALRHRNVEVVDEPPDQIAPALADAYLALKAAGRL
ncbi:MAG: DUF58 domain-containing protein [Streptosporangiales bacterium]|nr:DUF58 domain-containing protein [Streptosporangiales bacterium]